jgi:hypothetical protein
VRRARVLPLLGMAPGFFYAAASWQAFRCDNPVGYELAEAGAPAGLIDDRGCRSRPLAWFFPGGRN